MIQFAEQGCLTDLPNELLLEILKYSQESLKAVLSHQTVCRSFRCILVKYHWEKLTELEVSAFENEIYMLGSRLRKENVHDFMRFVLENGPKINNLTLDTCGVIKETQAEQVLSSVMKSDVQIEKLKLGRDFLQAENVQPLLQKCATSLRQVDITGCIRSPSQEYFDSVYNSLISGGTLKNFHEELQNQFDPVYDYGNIVQTVLDLPALTDVAFHADGNTDMKSSVRQISTNNSLKNLHISFLSTVGVNQFAKLNAAPMFSVEKVTLAWNFYLYRTMENMGSILDLFPNLNGLKLCGPFQVYVVPQIILAYFSKNGCKNKVLTVDCFEFDKNNPKEIFDPKKFGVEISSHVGCDVEIINLKTDSSMDDFILGLSCLRFQKGSAQLNVH